MIDPDSLCARCAHLEYDKDAKARCCRKRNKLNRYFLVIYIDKGFKTCLHFKTKREK